MVNSKPLSCLIAFAIFVVAQGAGAVGLPNVPNAHKDKFLPDTDNLVHAIKGGKPHVWLRLRYEDIDDDVSSPVLPLSGGRSLGGADSAELFSLRAVLGYTSSRFHGFYVRGELEAARRLNSDNAFNLDDDLRIPPPLNNNRAAEGHAVIPDNDFEEINEAYIGWRSPTGGCPMAPGPCNGNTSIKLGRQTIIYDNHRWVGDVIWRNNNQSFDAFRIDNTSIKNFGISYAYINKVKRLFGEESIFNEYKMDDSHLINISYKLPFGKLTAYGYLLDFDDNPRTPFEEGTGVFSAGRVGIPSTLDSPPPTPDSSPVVSGNIAAPFDSETWGIRFVGKHKLSDGFTLLSELEWANQDPDEDADSRLDDNDYYNIEFGGAFKAGKKPVVVKIGHEVLEGNGVNAVQTPLATVHAFNGWADKFVAGPSGSNTPANGLEDTSVTVVVKGLIGPSKLVFQHHRYEANEGSADYGEEWSVLFGKPFTKKWLGLVKYTNYDADDFSYDTKKLWGMLQYRFK